MFISPETMFSPLVLSLTAPRATQGGISLQLGGGANSWTGTG
jgi:hypothetical protein